MNRAMLEARLKDTAAAFSQEGYFPSLSLSVFTKDDILIRHTLGEARADSLFDIASLTKIATATMVLGLVEQGILALDTPLAAADPVLFQTGALGEALGGITIFQLLTHTATLPAWYPVYTQPDFPAALQQALSMDRPQGVNYSDLNFMILARVLKARGRTDQSGSPLGPMLCQPLGITGMYDALPPALMDKAIPSGYGNPQEEAMCARMGLAFTGFRPHSAIKGEVHDGNAHYAFYRQFAGHAGIFSDMDSLVTLTQHHLATDSTLFITATEEQAEGRGLGWQVGEMYPMGCGHTGFTGTSIYLSRQLDIGCVLLTNRCYYQNQDHKLTNPFRTRVHHLVADYAQAQQRA
ncbi:MAG: beta-lactamase family protein [Clostridiales bacterium]|nr:beta-lactamase family protein [Clostridiales bacterium]